MKEERPRRHAPWKKNRESIKNMGINNSKGLCPLKAIKLWVEATFLNETERKRGDLFLFYSCERLRAEPFPASPTTLGVSWVAHPFFHPLASPMEKT